MKNLVTLLLVLFAANVFAADVDTVKTFSKSMQKEIKAVVVTPSGYKEGTKFPVVTNHVLLCIGEISWCQ